MAVGTTETSPMDGGGGEDAIIPWTMDSRVVSGETEGKCDDIPAISDLLCVPAFPLPQWYV